MQKFGKLKWESHEEFLSPGNETHIFGILGQRSIDAHRFRNPRRWRHRIIDRLMFSLILNGKKQISSHDIVKVDFLGQFGPAEHKSEIHFKFRYRFLIFSELSDQSMIFRWPLTSWTWIWSPFSISIIQCWDINSPWLHRHCSYAHPSDSRYRCIVSTCKNLMFVLAPEGKLFVFPNKVSKNFAFRIKSRHTFGRGL